MQSTLGNYSSMRRYTPFLKLKVNEVGALKALPSDIFPKIRPFFDLPHQAERKEAELALCITKSAKKLKGLSSIIPTYFIDLFDIPDSLTIQGSNAFYAVASAFKEQTFIPVVGLDRLASYVGAVMTCSKNGELLSNALAIRLVEDDFQSFATCKGDLIDLIATGRNSGFSKFILILDMRVCLSKPVATLAEMVSKFALATATLALFSEIIVTGSSIPAQAGMVAATETEVDLGRAELSVFDLIDSLPKDLVGFGDYTVVSPDYSEINFAKELLRNVTAPKICYSYEDSHYILRGGALKTHVRGSSQYNDMASILVGKSFFRQPGYSFGEDFLIEKANGQGAAVTPSSILKPTICTHLTYMVRDHPLFA